MTELSAALKVVLANMYIMYLKSHSYHWNVEGMFFSQFHDFFGDLYSEVYGAIDPVAEHIRTLSIYAPHSFADILSATTIEEDDHRVDNVREMLYNLIKANGEVTSALNRAFQLAQVNNNQGMMNFLADRLDVHAKHGWQIRSYLQQTEAQ